MSFGGPKTRHPKTYINIYYCCLYFLDLCDYRVQVEIFKSRVLLKPVPEGVAVSHKSLLVMTRLSREFDSHRGHMSERFFRSNRPGYPHPVSSELENSGIRVAVGDCSVTERRRWRPPYQTGKTVHVHAKHYKHNEDGRTAPDVYGNGSVPLSHSGNVVTRIGIHTHTRLSRTI